MKPKRLKYQLQIETTHYKYLVQMDMLGEIQNRISIGIGKEISNNIDTTPNKKGNGFVTFESELVCMDSETWDQITQHLRYSGFDLSSLV